MRIELKKLKVVNALSEETTCYTAEIWVDGARAFLASNGGHGAADDFHQVGVVSEPSVNAWLAANRQPTRLGDTVLEHTLEFEVAALITKTEEAKRLRRSFKKQLVVIDGGKVFGYPLKGRSTSAVADAVRCTRPGIRVVNDDETAVEQAVDLLIAQSEQAGS